MHVHSIQQAFDLIDQNMDNPEVYLTIFEELAKKFWPGPLTIIVKADKKVPSVVTGDTGYVGLRMPNNTVALKLLREAKVPIAAPSANKFGHVSATTA